jgi:Ca-activated chloride channel family protein
MRAWSVSFERVRLGLVLIVTFVTIAAADSGRAWAQAVAPAKSSSPYFFIEGEAPAGLEAFSLESTDVVANVSGVIADVTVRQVYENRGTRPINARYVFPGSTRAAVHGMWFRIGDKKVVAKIRERQEATREFEEAKRAGKSASLLEQERPNVFTMSLANVMPGDRVEVELTYSELLVPTDGVYQFVYPTVVGPRYSKGASDVADDLRWVASPYLRAGQGGPSKVSIKVNVSAGMPVAEMRSPSHEGRAAIAWDNPALARVSLSGMAGDRDFILDYRLAGGAIQSGLLLHEGANERFFLLMVQPPARITMDQIPPREYVFVLDVSGSMHGFPLQTAKGVRGALFARMRPADSFNVVLFSGASQLLSPFSLPATKENLDRAYAIIDRQSGGGGTELEAALKTAMSLPRAGHVSRSVVVVTDGYIAEEREAFALIERNLENTNVFAFGIGPGVNRHLIEGVARAGRGEPFVVTNPTEAPGAAERFRRYIETPVMTEVRVSASGFDVYDVEPRTQPDLFAERPVVVFGKWRGPRRGQLLVTGRTASGPFQKVIEVASAPARAEHAALPQLWARSRIARLSDFNPGDDAEAKREVTALGLTYSLLTRHTSFIAVHETIRNPGARATDVQQPLPLPAGVSDLAVEGEAYGSGAEPSFYLLLALCGLTVLLLRRRVVAA